MNIEELTDEQRSALKVASVTDNELTFRANIDKTVDFIRYTDGDVIIEINDDRGDRSSYILTKEQIAFLVNWIS